MVHIIVSLHAKATQPFLQGESQTGTETLFTQIAGPTVLTHITHTVMVSGLGIIDAPIMVGTDGILCILVVKKARLTAGCSLLLTACTGVGDLMVWAALQSHTGLPSLSYSHVPPL